MRSPSLLQRSMAGSVGCLDHPVPVYQVKHPEQAYAESLYPAEPLRLLAAFRIWAAFEWFSPYRHLMDPGWDSVLEEALSRFSAARDAQEYHLAVAEMVSHVNDTHSETSSPVLTEFWGAAAPALVVRSIEGKAVVVAITDEAARSAGIATGDVIMSVDGENTEVRLSRMGRYISASAPQALRRDAVSRLLRGSNNSSARVRVAKADGSEREITLERRVAFLQRAMAPTDSEVFRLLSGNIGYIDLRLLKNHEVDRVFDALKDTVGLVFDMRGYPNDTRHAVARKLAAKEETVRTSWPYVRLLIQPGTETRQDLLYAVQRIAPSPNPYRGKTVMLIDERAQSQSEATAELLRAVHGTVFVGSPTAGANGEGTNFPVPGGLTVGMTGIGVVRADGTTVQRVGEKPDVVVLPTLQGIRSGRDEVLERGIAYLTNGR
jgi:C-terminal processing protease CtpA/Prc